MRLDSANELLGLFSIKGSPEDRWPGVITFGEKPSLRLLVVGDRMPSSLIPMAEEGEWRDFVGETCERGVLTVIKGRLGRWTIKDDGALGTISADVRSEAIWSGPSPFSNDLHLYRAKMRFSGIHGIVGTKELGHKYLHDEELDAVSLVVGKTKRIFYDAGAEKFNAHVDSLGISIIFGSIIEESFSWTEGDRIETSDYCTIDAPQGCSAADMIKYASDIERFLSFICVTPLHSDDLRMNDCDGDRQYERLWRLGDDQKTPKRKVMYHQALSCMFQDKERMTIALQRWLNPSYEESLARWLFHDCIAEDIVSVGRFITACQALEVVGREALGDQAPFDAKVLAIAADEAATLICQKLALESDANSHARFFHLIVSNNRASFRDHIKAAFNTIPDSLRIWLLPDEDDFIKQLISMRNTFVHMSGTRSKIEKAQTKLACMTYRCLALFAAQQGVALGLDPERVASGLANSNIGQIARHFISSKC